MMRTSTRAGIVRLNLGDAAQVRTAYAEISASAKAYAPQARIIGVSAQEMVREGVEIIIGVSCDPQLGPVLLFGSGGVMVEVYNDVALRRCPITRAEAQAMIAEVNRTDRMKTAISFLILVLWYISPQDASATMADNHVRWWVDCQYFYQVVVNERDQIDQLNRKYCSQGDRHFCGITFAMPLGWARVTHGGPRTSSRDIIIRL
jgi:hypothetical protein